MTRPPSSPSLRLGIAALGLAVLGVAGPTLAAQDRWERATPKVELPPRAWSAMAFDTHRGVAVLFGGVVDNLPLAETWEWDGSTWTRRTPAVSPSGRYGHGMAYDRKRGVMVMCGGTGTNPMQKRGTWEWDGSEWKERNSQQPQVWLSGAIAYDPVREQVIRHGGISGPVTGDTYAWDGAQWTLVQAGGPSPRNHHDMATDTLRKRVVLFGGEANAQRLGDTWEWDGIRWTQIFPPHSPPAHERPTMAYHAGIARTLLYKHGSRAMTWSFDGKDWVEHHPVGDPGEHDLGNMVYDDRRKVIVLPRSSGQSSIPSPTFLYYASPQVPAKVASFGAGCAGSAGVPALGFTQEPYIGMPLEIRMGNLPSSTFATPFLFLGASHTLWSGGTLPFDLSVLGATGCSLLVSPDMLFGLQNVHGSATLTATLPGSPSLVGTTAYAQGFVFDPMANTLGAVVSNGIAGTIGRR